MQLTVLGLFLFCDGASALLANRDLSTTTRRRPISTTFCAGKERHSTATELPSTLHSDDCCPSRRQLLRRLAWMVASGSGSALLVGSTTSQPALASQVRGPVELLRPATRVRLYIERAIQIVSSTENNVDKLAALSEFLEQETSFLTPDEERLSRRYLEIDTSTAWERARRKEREAREAALGIDYTTPYDQVNTAIQQWGQRRQFSILRGRQRNLEKANPMRAALNAYTNNLVFGDAYQLNVQGDAKKAMVRNESLPNVNAVVVSDLDLRDLYRNQVLENMEEARAEIEYQRNQKSNDLEDVLTYLHNAKQACDEWFSFIPSQDVQEALREVQNQNESLN